ncbi:MAG: hypothetical protein ABGZ53_04700 [Fuerstiella sp.]
MTIGPWDSRGYQDRMPEAILSSEDRDKTGIVKLEKPLIRHRREDGGHFR